MKSSERVIPLMGTYISLKIFHEKGEELLDQAETMLQDYNNRFSANDDSSQLMQVNLNAGKRAVKVDDDLFWLIKKAKEVSVQSEGAFNLAIGPVIKLWSIGFDDAHLPSDEEIVEKLELVDPRKVMLHEEGKEVYLKEEGMEIDLGAIAKGYFADELKEFFMSQGVEEGIVDLGGNVLTIGGSPTREDGYWRIGIQNPFVEEREPFLVLKIKDKSVVTSGINERKMEVDGKEYHHIFDGKTGYPMENDLASISIISEESIEGEIWTTILFSESSSEAIEKIRAIPDIDGLVVNKEGEAFLTESVMQMIQ